MTPEKLRPEITLKIELARKLGEQARFDEAERAYAEVLGSAPAVTEAIYFLAMRALSRKQFARATSLLEDATRIKPDDALLFRGLGLVHLQAGRLERALIALRQSVKLSPDHFARLLLGNVFEHMGQSYPALINYFGAIMSAQNKGLWMSAETTPAPQQELVRHAIKYVSEGRPQLFNRVLAPLQIKYGDTALLRVAEMLATYLMDMPARYTDSRQRPSFLFFPDLPARPYFESSLFPWLRQLEERTDLIRAELSTILQSTEKFEPFHHSALPGQTQSYLRHTRESDDAAAAPAWDTFFLFRHGLRIEANCLECPETAATLESIPLVRIRDHAPESLFSVLRPGTHILPHRGVTNTRLVVHLPLVIPADCALRVGGETHAWQEGKAVVFDDTFEHEAWNNSDQVRAVLIADVWNPYLTEVEQAGVEALIVAIGDFNRDCGIS